MTRKQLKNILTKFPSQRDLIISQMESFQFCYSTKTCKNKWSLTYCRQEKIVSIMIKMRKAEKCRGEFEQLARYTTRYQESDLHLAFILLNLLTTSTYTARFSVLPLLYFSSTSACTSSSIVTVLIAKAGHVWVSWPEKFLLYFIQWCECYARCDWSLPMIY